MLTLSSTKISQSTRAISYIIMAMKDGDFMLDGDYQRPYVWQNTQQQELMHSLFNDLPIGAISLIEHAMTSEGAYVEVLDGKQRITTIFAYYNNEFAYIDPYSKKSYFYRDLSPSVKTVFKNSITYAVNTLKSDMTELQKYEYFYAINYAGVEQSESHRINIERKLEALRDAA
jgi:uncharacterized protein with ParB-like and HNH nuclease domain